MQNVMCKKITLANNEKLILIGISGLCIHLIAAFIDPSLLKNAFAENDVVKIIIAVSGTIMSIAGFMAFFSEYSLKNIKLNIFRVLYIIMFIIASNCSNSGWECFH